MTEKSALERIAEKENALRNERNRLRREKRKALESLKKDLGAFAYSVDKERIDELNKQKKKEDKLEYIMSLTDFNDRYDISPKSEKKPVVEGGSGAISEEQHEQPSEISNEKAHGNGVLIPREDFEYLKIVVKGMSPAYNDNWRMERDNLQPFMNELHKRVSEWKED